MLWFPAIILSTWQRINELEDPTFNHIVDTSNFYVSVRKSLCGGTAFIFNCVGLNIRSITKKKTPLIFA